jgi:hypothetical protein
MMYQALSPVVGCCPWTVVAHPGFGDPGPVSLDCGPPLSKEPAAGGAGILSTNTALCPCTVDTRESTWGALKELFRQGI